jgi:hypothetical protein
MLENTLKDQSSQVAGETWLARDGSLPSSRQAHRWPLNLVLCALGMVICVLLTMTPLIRLPDSVIHLHIAAGAWLAAIGSWLPLNLGGLPQPASAALELFFLLLLLFLCYGLGALLVRREPATAYSTRLRGIILTGAALAGLLYVITPAMLSHDILVYASYSRVLAAYHANPYFIPIAAFPHDPFTPINYWSRTVSAYGPLWMLVCGVSGALFYPNPVTYVVAFRLFAVGTHLLNSWLVGRTLAAMGRSPRTISLGMLLYAWNPLLLLESGLGGHNDGFMITFVLLGALLAARAQTRGQLLRPRGYLPAVAALTLAALVKFTALPILAAFLLFLACKALRPSRESSYEVRTALRNWRPVLLTLLVSGLTAALVALALYGPFWVGHSLQDIVASFKNPPSALYAQNSFMRSTVEWLHLHPAQPPGALQQLLINRHLWDDLNIAAIALCLLLGAVYLWRRPTVKVFLLVSLLTMGIVLLITPWFFAWYVTWLLGLAVLSLPARQSRIASTLMVLAFTFSVSALATYLLNATIIGTSSYLMSLFIIIPPACVSLLTLVLWQPVKNKRTGERTS